MRKLMSKNMVFRHSSSAVIALLMAAVFSFTSFAGELGVGTAVISSEQSAVQDRIMSEHAINEENQTSEENHDADNNRDADERDNEENTIQTTKPEVTEDAIQIPSGIVEEQILTTAEKRVEIPDPAQQVSLMGDEDVFSVFEGSGTSEEPYLIADVDDLISLGAIVNGGDNCSEKYFKVSAEINMQSVENFSPIGTAENGFAGSFDGDHKEISKLKVINNGGYTALFGNLLEDGTIQNVDLRDCEISQTKTSGNNYTAGICANGEGKIKNCSVTGEISNVGAYTGGISGYSLPLTAANITRCYADVKITAVGNLGGIVGYGSADQCFANVDITSTGQNVGGISGFCNGGFVSNSYTTGTISCSRQSIGGIVGRGSVSDCWTTTALEATSPTIMGFIGGIMSQNGTASNCLAANAYIYMANSGARQARITGNESLGGTRNFSYAGMPFYRGGVGYYIPENQRNAAGAHGSDIKAINTSTQPFDAWEKNVWNFTEGQMPKLKNIDAVQSIAVPEYLLNSMSGSKKEMTADMVTFGKLNYPYTGSEIIPEIAVKDENEILIEGTDYTVELKDNVEKSASAKVNIIGKGDYIGVTGSLFTICSENSWTGSGTKNDPYVLSTPEDFVPLRDDVNNGVSKFSGTYFKLGSNIDFEGATVAAIGLSYNNCFDGNFDGGGYSIKNFRINQNSNYAAFFGYVSNDASFSNLNMENAEIVNTGSYTAVLAGYGGPDIDNCHVISGKISGNSYIGGLIASMNISDGDNDGIISNSSFNGTIVGTGSIIGGIIGRVNIQTNNCGIITNCYANTDITSTNGGVIGGIVGDGSGVTIDGCWFDGNIKGRYSIGGLVGSMRQGFMSNVSYPASVKNSYSTGTIKGIGISFDLGGLVGGIASGGESLSTTLSDCYSTCAVDCNYSGNTSASNSNRIGGLVGSIDSAVVVMKNLAALNENIKYNIEYDGALRPGRVYGQTVTYNLNLPQSMTKIENNYALAEMNLFLNGEKTNVTFADKGTSLMDGADVSGLASFEQPFREWNSDVWSFADGRLPILVNLSQAAEQPDSLPSWIPQDKYGIAGGNGTQTNPYRISSKDDLLAFADEVKRGDQKTGVFYMLTADIDMKNVSWTGSGTFGGNLDGSSFEILNLNANSPLFEALTADASVKNLGLTTVSISSDRAVGAIARSSGGIIENCYAKGKIEGKGYTGGIVGSLQGTTGDRAVVKNCFFTGEVSTSGDAAGGVAAASANAAIENCYMNASVVSMNNAGGITGIAENGTSIKGCYALNTVSSSAINAGGITGKSLSGSQIENCVALCERIIAVTDAGRITGKEKGAVFTENYASSVMDVMLNGARQTVTGTSDNQHGAELVGNIGSGIAPFGAWLSSAWTIQDNCLPILTGIKANVQGKEMPSYLSANAESGTQANPYQIGSLSQLEDFRDDVNKGDKYNGKYVELTSNIDMSSVSDWQQIEDFEGYFSGNGKTISSLTTSGSGLFKEISGNGYLRNINLSDVSITGSGRACAVGTLSNSASVSEVNVTGNINSTYTSGVGGVVGKASALCEINDCSFTGSIVCPGAVGGITSQAYNILNCKSSGTVSGGAKAAGIAATLNYAMSNCSSSMDVNGTIMAGGLVGMESGLAGTVRTSITNSFSTGNVTGQTQIGGLVGYASYMSINNCYSTGNVTGSGTASTGGLLGYALMGSVENCYASGDIKGKNTVGGIIGDMVGVVTVKNCVNMSIKIVGGESAHRCFGLAASTSVLEKNYALNGGYLMNGMQSITPNTEGVNDGQNLNAISMHTEPFAEWSETIWTINNGEMPVLKCFEHDIQPYLMSQNVNTLLTGGELEKGDGTEFLPVDESAGSVGCLMLNSTLPVNKAKSDGFVVRFKLPEGYHFDFDESTIQNLANKLKVEFTIPDSGLLYNKDNILKTYLESAFSNVSITADDRLLTITTGALNTDFNSFASGTNSGDITIAISFEQDGLIVKNTAGTFTASTVTLYDNTLTLQEDKAITYIIDGSGTRTRLSESDIRSGADRYVVIEQNGNAGGSYNWTIFPGSNGWRRRPQVAINVFSTQASDLSNRSDEDTAWGMVEDYWCDEDDNTVNGLGDNTKLNRYWDLKWLRSYEMTELPAESNPTAQNPCIIFKIPQIEEFTIAEDTTIYCRLLRGMVGGTGGGGGSPILEPYWGTNGVANFVIENNVVDSVTSVATLAPAVLTQTANIGAELSSLNLPKTLTVTVNGLQKAVPVTWQTSGQTYDSTKQGTYTFTAVIPDVYTIESGVTLPVIHVSVSDQSGSNPETGETGSSGETGSVVTKPTNPPVVEDNGFTDVKDSDWFAESVDFVVEKGFFKGISDNTFEPDASMTRAMFVTVIGRMNGSSIGGKSVFDDVAEGVWYSESVAWAADKGIVRGIGVNRFAPNKSVSREELAVMLYNYALFSGLDVSDVEGMAIREFDDYSNISVWAETAVRWALNVGLLQGDDKNMLNPKATATRAEVAVIIHRYFNK